MSKPVLLITMNKAKMQRQKLAKEKATDSSLHEEGRVLSIQTQGNPEKSKSP